MYRVYYLYLGHALRLREFPPVYTSVCLRTSHERATERSTWDERSSSSRDSYWLPAWRQAERASTSRRLTARITLWRCVSALCLSPTVAKPHRVSSIDVVCLTSGLVARSGSEGAVRASLAYYLKFPHCLRMCTSRSAGRACQVHTGDRDGAAGMRRGSSRAADLSRCY